MPKHIIALAAILIGLAVPVAASAQTATAPVVSCSLKPSLIPGTSSDAKHIRIREPDRKIDHYLPRCDLATFVVGLANDKKQIVLKGSRWFVGSFTCAYKYGNVPGRDEVRIATKCVHHGGQYPTTVWFDTYG